MIFTLFLTTVVKVVFVLGYAFLLIFPIVIGVSVNRFDFIISYPPKGKIMSSSAIVFSLRFPFLKRVVSL